MSIKSKPILILIATLALGVLIGTLLVGPMAARHHFRRLDALRTPEGFASRMESIIKPDDSQVRPVSDILTKYATQFDEINKQHHVAMQALADSMRRDLDQILTDEQEARLEHSKRHRGGGSPRPPH